jgi:hypothetical protein
MNDSVHTIVAWFVGIGALVGGGLGFVGGLSNWGILAGIVLGVVGAAGGAVMVAWFVPGTDENSLK